jgi:hypothetical protein
MTRHDTTRRILALVLMVVYCAVAAAVAVVLYLFLYHNFVPIIAFHKPVYFDFTYSARHTPHAPHTHTRTHAPHARTHSTHFWWLTWPRRRAEPWAVADFADKWSPSGRPQGVDHLRAGGSGGGPTVVATPVLSPGHLYDFALDLQLPESPINDRIGNHTTRHDTHDTTHNTTRGCAYHSFLALLSNRNVHGDAVPVLVERRSVGQLVTARTQRNDTTHTAHDTTHS